MKRKILKFLIRFFVNRKSNRIIIYQELYGYYKNMYYDQTGYGRVYDTFSEFIESLNLKDRNFDKNMVEGGIKEEIELHYK